MTYEVRITLPMTFYPDSYEEELPDATKEQIVASMKQDFLDCIYKQWTEEEVLDYLDVEIKEY